MDNDYVAWIAVLTVSGAFGVGVIGWVLWKSCTRAPCLTECFFPFNQMPRVPDASSVTRYHRVNAAPLRDGVRSAILRSSQVGQTISPSTSTLAAPIWRGRQFAATRYITGGSSSPPEFVFILKNIPDTNDPGDGFFGFQVVPAVFVFSKTDANGRDASAFLSAMSTATTFTITVQSGSGQGAEIWTIDGTPTDEGTHWLFPYAFPPIGPGIVLEVGDHVVLTYTV